MNKVSLIVATLGERPNDLCALLRSVMPQTDFIREIIVVDQHSDPKRIPHLLEEFENVLPIRHTRSERGLSRASNHGLSSVTGGIVAFPDDDCLYTDGLLEWVVNWFDSNIEYDILAVGVKDSSGVMSGNRWQQDSCEIGALNAFRTTFSSSLFLCADLATTERFDVDLGIGSGTAFGCGEETDYVLRLLSKKARGRFDRTQCIIHPRRDMLSGSASLPRALSYGFGMGHVLNLHSLHMLWVGFLIYNLGRAGISLLRGNQEGARLCVTQTKGLWKGYLARTPVRRLQDLAADSSPQLIQFTRPQNAGSTEYPIPSALRGASLRNVDEITKADAGGSREL